MPAIHISRTIEIEAPPQVVFETLKNFKTWPTWSPWLLAEPDCSVQYSPDGKNYSWDGKYVGAGEMTLVGETANQLLKINLQFLKPWKSRADNRFRLEPTNNGTRVIWEMDSGLPFFMFFIKGMMEGLIGMDFSRGLAMLKDFIETGSVPVKLEFGEATTGPFNLVGIRTDCSMDAMIENMERDAAKITSWKSKSSVSTTGPMMCVYHKWDIPKSRVIYTIGFPITGVPASLPDGLVTFDIPAAKCATVTFTGPYRHLGNAWSAGIMRGRGGAFRQCRKPSPFEIYLNSPDDTPETDLVTVVHFPVR